MARRPTPQATTKTLAHIRGLFFKLLARSPLLPNIVPAKVAIARAYELQILAIALRNLRASAPGNYIRYVGRPAARLNISHGPVKLSHDHFIIEDASRTAQFQIHTNIEFIGISGESISSPLREHRHELDVIVLPANFKSGFPHHHEVLLGVEAKSGKYGKHLLKELLGVRREMCFLASGNTSYLRWPATRSHASTSRSPIRGGHLVSYCPDVSVLNYKTAACHFGIELFHEVIA